MTPPPDFATLYRTHGAYVRRTLQRMGVPDRHLDDAMQDVFVVVLRRLPEYQDRQRLTGWLAAIAHKIASSGRATMRTSMFPPARALHPPSGERLAQRMLFDAVRTVAWKVLGRHGLSGADREDLAQDVAIAAFRRRLSYRAERGSPGQWISGIATSPSARWPIGSASPRRPPMSGTGGEWRPYGDLTPDPG